MGASSAAGRIRLPRGTRLAARQGGAIMMFVLLAALVLSVVTLGVLRLVSGDITEGFGGLEAVQAFNVAEAGIHNAIGKLNAPGANTYAGETLTVASGTTTLGTATIAINCIDAPNPPLTFVPPCSTSLYPAYRRIVSTSTLPMSGASGGPTRTIVAVLKSTQTPSTYGICAGTRLGLDHWYPIYADVGSNGSFSMDSEAHVFGDPGSPQAYTGKAVYVTTISCETNCSPPGGTKAAGYELDKGATVGPPPCPTMVAPTFSPGASPLSVTWPAGYTMNIGTGYSWGDVVVNTPTGGSAISGTPPACNKTVDLRIVTPAVGSTQIVYMNTLQMQPCTRLILLGGGAIDLRIGSAVASSTSGLQLATGAGAPITPSLIRFGATSTDTWTPNVRAPINPGQLTVSVNSTSLTNPYAVSIWGVDYVYASFLVPNGYFYFSGILSPLSTLMGNINASQIQLEENGQYLGSSGGAGGASGYTLFTNLMSWKDQ